MTLALPLAHTGGSPAQPVRVPAQPDEHFLCSHLRCTLRGRICVERQGSVRAASATAKDRSAKPDLRFGYCVSGDCVQGREVAAALAGQTATSTVGSWGSGLNTPAAKAQATTEGLALVARVEARLAARDGFDSDEGRTYDGAPSAPEVVTMETKVARTCSADGCDRALGANNKSGRCTPHFIPKKKLPQVPPLTRETALKAVRWSADEASGELVRIGRLLADYRALSDAGRTYVDERLGS